MARSTKTMTVAEVKALGAHRYTLVMPATKAQRTENPKAKARHERKGR